MSEIPGLSFSLKILTWNINGIRTIKKLKETLDSLEADIVCLQETKITRDTIDEETALLIGYNSYFSFCRVRSGYSGVATYCKSNSVPHLAEEGLSGILVTGSDKIGCYGDIPIEFSPQELKQLDYEGRAIITQHKVQDCSGSEHWIHVINVYCPRADPERAERLTFKLKFYQLLEMRAAALRQIGHVIIVGDINTSHCEVDRCQQLTEDEFENNPARQWLNRIILNTHTESDLDDCATDRHLKLVDSFRYFHPSQTDAYTCWNTQIGARSTNYGSRIDYIFVNKELVDNMLGSVILSDIMGSDHCPVSAHFQFKVIPARKPPSLCSKNYPEFSGTQSTLSSFLSDCQTCTKFEEPLDKKRRVDKGIKKGKDSQMNILKFFQKNCPDTKEMKAVVLEDTEVPVQVVEKNREKSTESAAAWKSVLKGPQPAPLCSGHNEPSVQRVVKKNGPNRNRRFWVCARGEGRANDPNARCNYFKWASSV